MATNHEQNKPVNDRTTTIRSNANEAETLPPIEGESDTRQQLSRLSLALIGCDGARSKIEKAEIDQALIYGALTGLTGPKELPDAKTPEEKYTYGLIGDIEAVNMITGEIYRGGVLYLPGGFHDLFLAQMESQLGPVDADGNRPGKGGFEIQFALKFASIPADNKSGYSWKAYNQMPPQEHDRLARIRQRALKDQKIGQLRIGGAKAGDNSKLIEGTATHAV